MKCYNCGADLAEGAKFCSFCGTKTSEQEAAVPSENYYKRDAHKEAYKEPDPAVLNPQDVNAPSKAASTFGNKVKTKFLEFWNQLDLFGKTATISITLSVLLGLVAFLAGRIFAGIISVVWLAVAIVAILMKKDVIKIPKTWMPFLTVILSFLLVVPYFSLFKVNVADYEKYNWNDVVLADMLPIPESPYGEIISNSERHLTVYLTKSTQTQYEKYINSCKEKGFTIDAETSGRFFYAFNTQGYKLSLSYYEYSSEMHISLSVGNELGFLTWPDSKLVKLLPKPDSTVGEIQKDDETGFNAYVGNTTVEAFKDYVAACASKGFNIDSNKTDKRFFAKNASGYGLTVEYQGNNVIYLSLDAPEYNVSIEVECVENWFFSKYDVNVYVNDSLQGTIAHGDTETFELTFVEGTYTLKFVSKEDSKLTGIATLHIYQSENLKYKISCSSSGIDVETIIGTTPVKDETDEVSTAGYPLDYTDAASFEAALNNGVKVNGKIVQFSVVAYKPGSVLGINCWAGEHLNFISENKLNVAAGDVIIGYVSAEPSKTLGSWEIHYIVLAINNVKTDATIPDEPDIAPEDTSSPTTEPANTAGAPDDWTKLLEKHYEEVKKQFEDAGFTNITCVAHELDYNESKSFEGSVVNIAIGENGEICTFAKGELWPKDIKIRIDYRVKPTEPEKPDITEIVLPKAGSKLSKDFDFEGTSTIYYINVDGTSNKPSIKSWGSATVTDGVAEYLDYLKSLGFTVTITSKSHKEPYSGFYVYETNFKVSNSSVSWTMYLCIQKEKYIEYELDINKN